MIHDGKTPDEDDNLNLDESSGILDDCDNMSHGLQIPPRKIGLLMMISHHFLQFSQIFLILSIS
jgi:hypothetical protein